MRRAAEEKARHKEAKDEIAGTITQGILEQAARGGFAVHEETEQALLGAEEEAQQQAPLAEPPPDPVDRIITSIEGEQASKTEEIAELMEQEEIEAELTMPDFEAEADAELLNQEIAEDGEGMADFSQEWEEEEPDMSDARRRAIVAEKKAAYYENLAANRERKKWRAEAAKHFPHSVHALDKIQANSRKGFLREAKQAHDTVKDYVKQATTIRLAELDAEREGLAEAERVKAENAWGKPTAGPGSPAPGGPDYSHQIAKARADNDLPLVLTLKRLEAEARGEVQ
jgi:hypothetical protein